MTTLAEGLYLTAKNLNRHAIRLGVVEAHLEALLLLTDPDRLSADAAAAHRSARAVLDDDSWRTA